MKPRELAALIALAALWGGSFLFIRIAVPAFGPLALMGARVALAALVLAVVSVLLPRGRLELRKHTRHLLVLGAINAAIPFTLIAYAELRLTASFTSVLNAAVPLFTSVFSIVWLRERIVPTRALGLFLGDVGVGILVGWSPIPLTPSAITAIAAMLVATALYAAAGIYTKRYLDGVPPLTLALGQQLGAAAWLVVPSSLWQRPMHAVPPAALWALVGLVVLSTASAYLLYFYLIARVGPTRTYTVTYLIPLFGIAWGALFLDEPVSRSMVVGLTVILTSLVLVTGIRLPRLTLRRASRATAPRTT